MDLPSARNCCKNVAPFFLRPPAEDDDAETEITIKAAEPAAEPDAVPIAEPDAEPAAAEPGPAASDVDEDADWEKELSAELADFEVVDGDGGDTGWEAEASELLGDDDEEDVP